MKYHIWILLVAFQNENKISGTMTDLLANKRTLSLQDDGHVQTMHEI